MRKKPLTEKDKAAIAAGKCPKCGGEVDMGDANVVPCLQQVKKCNWYITRFSLRSQTKSHV